MMVVVMSVNFKMGVMSSGESCPRASSASVLLPTLHRKAVSGDPTLFADRGRFDATSLRVVRA